MNKKRTIKALVLTAVCAFLIMCVSIPVAAAAGGGTDGTELRVAEPEQLEIQLGPAWEGVEFQLKTDAGLYPGVIPVGSDGVLRLEIGGSSFYTLTCLNSPMPIPEPSVGSSQEEPQAPVTSEPITSEPVSSEPAEDHGEVLQPVEPEDPSVAGIPVLHLCLFGGGVVLATGALIVMYVLKQRKSSFEDDEDEFDDE